MEKEMKFCQSCMMPMTAPELFGTEKDGSANQDYCCYCYKDGAFTHDCTMEQMIESCVPIMVKEVPGMTAEAARAQMQEGFPTLKRWKK